METMDLLRIVFIIISSIVILVAFIDVVSNYARKRRNRSNIDEVKGSGDFKKIDYSNITMEDLSGDKDLMSDILEDIKDGTMVNSMNHQEKVRKEEKQLKQKKGNRKKGLKDLLK